MKFNYSNKLALVFAISIVVLNSILSNATEISSYPGMNPQFSSRLTATLNQSIKEWKNLWLTQNVRSEDYLNKVLGPKISSEEKEKLVESTIQLKEVAEFDCNNKELRPAKLPEFCTNKESWLQQAGFNQFAMTLKIPLQNVVKMNDPKVIKMLQDFVSNAKILDPKIDEAGIFQASRNVWIAATLQKILNVDVQLTSPLYGYSMLYPYTDNVFDDPNLAKEAKGKFAKKFGSMLLGKNIELSSDLEIKVLENVNRMYDTFSPSQYPDVKQAVLSIYYGQMESMRQRDPSLSAEEILWISAFKGGTSVLADSYLAKPVLSEKEFQVSFDFGFLLQMVDDLQDLEKDQNEGFNSRTVFHNPKLDKKMRTEQVIQLVDYSHFIIKRLNELYPNNEELTQTMDAFIQLIIFEAVAQQPDQFDDKLVSEIEARSSLSFDNLSKAEIEKNMYQMIQRIDLK